jgi:hypothetical protein
MTTQTASATVTGISPVGVGTHSVAASYTGDVTYLPVVQLTIFQPMFYRKVMK